MPLLTVITFFFATSVLLIFFTASFNWAVYSLVAFFLWFPLIASQNRKRLLLILLTLSLQVSVDFQLLHRGDTRVAGAAGISMSLTFIIVLVIFAIWVLERSPRPVFYREISLPALFFIGAGIISMINTPNKFLSVCAMFQLIKMFLLYLVVANTVRSKENLKLCVNMLMICLVVQGVLYLAQNAMGFTFDSTAGPTVGHGLTQEGLLRLGGTFGNTSGIMAIFFAALIPISLSVLITKREDFPKRFLPGVAAPAGMVSLVLTFARSSWASFAVCGLAFVSIASKRGWLRLRAFIFSLAVVSILLAAYLPVLSTRLGEETLNTDWETRNALNKIAWNMIKSHPIIGIGINGFHDVQLLYLTDDIETNWVRVVHNQYLKVWAETGTLGIIAFVWFLLATLKKGISCLRATDALLAPLSLGLTLGFITILLNMTLNQFGAESQNNLLWFLVGLMTATWELVQDGKNQDADDHVGSAVS